MAGRVLTRGARWIFSGRSRRSRRWNCWKRVKALQT